MGSQGVRLGIIAKGMARGPGGAFTEAGPAVPLGTVIGLANGSGDQAPGSGTVLQTAAIRLAR